MRPAKINTGVLKYAEGSVLIHTGDTQVLCAASIRNEVPRFLENTGSGWVTAEYALLPRSTRERVKRESAEGRLQGRTQEIQRLIGRSLRAVMDLNALGERTIVLDCDVIQADGGTRTASVTGAFTALVQALRLLRERGELTASPIREAVAAVSVGVVDDEVLLDLDYEEDHRAQTDLNLVMTSSGAFVEIQGTAEKKPFDAQALDRMLELGTKGIRALMQIQLEALGGELW